MSPRRHRWITVPSGGLLFACLVLPGYRECSINYAMTSSPLLVAICLFGLAAVVGALMVPRRRGERALAIGFVVLAAAAAGVLAFACLAVDHVYAGITIGLAAVVGVAAGALVWEREARGRHETAARYLKALVPLVLAGLVITAVASTWVAPPNEPLQIPGLVVH